MMPAALQGGPPAAGQLRRRAAGLLGGPASNGRAGLIIAALAVAGLVLFWLPLPGIALGRMTGLGLISVLPAATLAGTALLLAAFLVTLGLPLARPAALGVLLACITVCLDGITAVAEPAPRFPTAYQIAGFIDYISRTGHTAPGLDAYFSWPGFFALVAFLAGAAGGHDLITVIRWWPAAIDLLCLVPLMSIMRSLRASWRARWFAALLFCLANWVGQDYFSPQSADFLLYLAFLAILLNWFGWPAPAAARGHRPRAGRGRWRRAGQLRPGERRLRPASHGQRALALLLLVAIFVTSTVSHQLTPFFMLAACGVLVLARRCALTGLPVLLGVILAGWISFATVAYWSGHLGQVFGGFGHLGANLTASVGGRLVGSTPQHELVLYTRAGLAALMLVLAVLGVVRRRRAGIGDRAAVVLLAMPFLALAAQSYGGEIALRAYLFALPAACFLAGCLFFPASIARRRAGRPVAAGAVLAVVLAGLFFVARYGNEAFEQTPPGELTALSYLYARDSSGLRVLWLNQPPISGATPQMPWQYRDIEKISYVTAVAPRDPAQVDGLLARLRGLGPGSYLMTTTTQEAYLRQEGSYPAGWARQLRAHLATAPGVHVAFEDQDAVLYALSFGAGTPVRPLPVTAAGQLSRSTGWTPAGLAALWLLLGLLGARELIRASLPDWRWLLRPLTLAAWPLLALLLVAVAERFAVLS